MRPFRGDTLAICGLFILLLTATVTGQSEPENRIRRRRDDSTERWAATAEGLLQSFIGTLPALSSQIFQFMLDEKNPVRQAVSSMILSDKRRQNSHGEIAKEKSQPTDVASVKSPPTVMINIHNHGDSQLFPITQPEIQLTGTR